LISDLWTVMWKEWKELLVQRGSLRGGLLSLLVVVAFFSVIPPLQIGSDWVDSPVVLFLSGWVSFLLVSSIVADSFAGERERHTLETLLASRLPDRAILLGKVCMAVSYGSGLMLLVLVLGLLTVNLASGHGILLFYQGIIGLGSVGLSLLGALLAASAGVLVSLRAPTVLQAQQTLSFAAILLPLILYGLVLGSRILSIEWPVYLMTAIASSSMTEIVVIVMVALGLLDIGLMALALVRFQRSQLILY
jgi:ABC-2 type transport system permease protein